MHVHARGTVGSSWIIAWALAALVAGIALTP